MLKRSSGRVKWFNKKGFGFITAMGGSPFDGEDVFVHHSSIHTEGDIYKYLVEGEYVTFTWTETTDNDHKYHATDVRGINNWQLMCETRAASRLSSNGDGGTHSRQRRGQRLPPREHRGEAFGGRERNDEQKTTRQRVRQTR